jgi:hypothetical protein
VQPQWLQHCLPAHFAGPRGVGVEIGSHPAAERDGSRPGTASHRLRLYAVSSRFRDTLVAVQRDAVALISDRPGFEQVKSRAADELARIAESCAQDARTAAAEEELNALWVITAEALLALPFPEELSIGRESSKHRAVDVGIQAIGSLLGGGDPVRHVQDEVEAEIRSRMTGLRRRYSEWWDKYAASLQSAANQMQDKLFLALEKVASEEN